KILGLFTVKVALHPEVIVPVRVNVARSEEEAERQARGEVAVTKEESTVVEEVFAESERQNDISKE
ncbi:MAG: 50S ribosomal protein L9, partial [Acetobacter sp.]|nr:50S ribosomal protein L9 [Acetobacter sp.]